MDTIELIKACKMAGMKITQNVLGIWVNTGFSVEFIENPMLPSYVASLLVAKVRDSVLDIRELYVMQFANNSEAIDATDEQRIRAAMAVLEKSE